MGPDGLAHLRIAAITKHWKRGGGHGHKGANQGRYGFRWPCRRIVPHLQTSPAGCTECGRERTGAGRRWGECVMAEHPLPPPNIWRTATWKFAERQGHTGRLQAAPNQPHRAKGPRHARIDVGATGWGGRGRRGEGRSCRGPARGSWPHATPDAPPSSLANSHKWRLGTEKPHPPGPRSRGRTYGGASLAASGCT
jgi:hypothetical protein